MHNGESPAVPLLIMPLLTLSLSILEGRSFLGLPPAAAMAAATLAAADRGSCGPPCFTAPALDATAACLPPLALLLAVGLVPAFVRVRSGSSACASGAASGPVIAPLALIAAALTCSCCCSTALVVAAAACRRCCRSSSRSCSSSAKCCRWRHAT
jgi:hypothetical protein